MLTYKNVLDSNNDIKMVRVLSDGKLAGAIESVSGYEDGKTYWRYVPKGRGNRKKYAGELLHSIPAVKKTLEIE